MSWGMGLRKSISAAVDRAKALPAEPAVVAVSMVAPTKQHFVLHHKDDDNDDDDDEFVLIRNVATPPPTVVAAAPPPVASPPVPPHPSIFDDDFDIGSMVLLPAGAPRPTPSSVTDDKHPFDDIFV